jgi:hypothetical protein
MKGSIKLAVFTVVGLLILALVASPAVVQRPQAQEARPKGSAPEGSTPHGDGVLAAEDEGEAASADLRIPGTVLKPRSSTVEWGYGGQGGCTYASSGDQYVWWNTGVYLAQGATVTLLRVYVDDTNAISNSEACFTVYDLNGEIHEEWCGSGGGIGGNTFYDVPVANHVIDYSLYSYVVNWQPNDLGSDMQLCGFRISYTPPGGKAYMPAVLRDGP